MRRRSADESSPADVLFVRGHVTGMFPLALLVSLPLLLGLVQLDAADLGGTARAVGNVAILGTALAVVVLSWLRVGVILTPTAITARGLFSVRRVPWADVAAVEPRWVALRSGVGWCFDLVARPGIGRIDFGSVQLQRAAVAKATAYIERHGLGVPVAPEEPWKDRFGVWHGPFQEYDPAESVRSVRRAAVGPHTIRVEVSKRGYQAVTWGDAGEVVRRSPWYDTRREATEAALEHIRLSQAEL